MERINFNLNARTTIEGTGSVVSNEFWDDTEVVPPND